MSKIIITGAGSGLGFQLAKIYSKERNYVILMGRTMSKLEEAVQKITSDGGQAEYITCDISNPEDVKKAIASLIDTHSDIDSLINNVGVGYFGALEEMEIEDISNMIDINVKGTIYMTREILPYFKTNKKGKVLNIISTAGLRGKVHESAYAASKFAIRGFTESLQKELEDQPIDITAVYMGGMNTPFWENSSLVDDPSVLKSPSLVADLIFKNDDGRNEIFIDR